jgi:hypothetical protein
LAWVDMSALWSLAFTGVLGCICQPGQSMSGIAKVLARGLEKKHES